MWLGVRIGPYRLAAGVRHPCVHASTQTITNATSIEQRRALYLFNCAQRAHHNVMENYSPVLSGMLIGGLFHPLIAANLGIIWVFGRIIYAVSYTSTSKQNVDGRGRFFYGGFHLAAASQVALLILVGKIGVSLLRSN